MKHSQLFTKSSKNSPADETAKNAQLLIKAGFVQKEMAGVYSYLPLGIKVIENIKEIVRKEMNAIGGQELLMSTLQPKDNWAITDRWDDKKVDIWFKSSLKNGTDVGFGWSHEEPITLMMRNHINSYKDLPVYVYQFQTKFRNELRAKSGLMRGREFIMKDMYSYCLSEEAHQKFYDIATQAYMRVFATVGLGDYTFVTFASGGAFTQFSHEFQTVTDSGEDTIYLHRDKKIAINKEVLNDEVMTQLDVQRDQLEEVKASEVGNIFSFGSTKSEQLDLYFVDKDDNKKPVILGSYGIGVSRLMGVIAEHFADDKGLVWPENIAPFRVYLVQIGDSKEVKNCAQDLYDLLNKQNISVLWDDRDERPGVKFADADLYGLPNRIVVSQTTLKSRQYELKKRTSTEVQLLNKESLIKSLVVS